MVLTNNLIFRGVYINFKIYNSINHWNKYSELSPQNFFLWKKTFIPTAFKKKKKTILFFNIRWEQSTEADKRK